MDLIRSFYVRSSARKVLIALVALGVICVICAQAIPAVRKADPWNHLLTTFGDALLATGVIGLLVEIPLRAVANDDLSQAVFYAVFGIRAPTEYFDQLRDVCRTDCLCYATKWDIKLNWHEKPNILAVEMQASVTTHNISQSPSEQRGIWIMGSAPGTPGSRFVHYSLRLEDDRGNVTPFRDVDEKELEHLIPDERQPEDPLAIGIVDLIGQSQYIPPNGQSLAVTTGILYLTTTGLVPLVQRYPTMGVRFFISGDALPDLTVNINSGTTRLQPDHLDDMVEYDEPGLCLPGTTYRVEIGPNRAQLALPVRDDSVG
jgi:hypothetical protein